MNPRTNYEEADTATARAFVHLFIWHNDLFKFGIDAHPDEEPVDEELRAWVSVTNHKDADGRSTLGITGINQTEKFNEIADTVRTMGLTVIEDDEVVKESEEIGEYTANVIRAYAEEDAAEGAEWNTPCLLVYGYLSPELKETCHAAFGQKFDYHDIRNHYVIVGDGLNADHRTRLSDTVSQASYIFDDEKRDLKSSIHTSALI